MNPAQPQRAGGDVRAYRRQIRAQKFVVVPSVLSPDESDLRLGEAMDAMSHARKIRAEPGGPGAVGDEPLEYGVLRASEVQRLLPSVFDWYMAKSTKSWVRDLLGRPVPVMPVVDFESSINVNYLQGPGGFYQAHRDNVSCTALLFLQDFEPHEGGGLELWGGWHKTVIQPRKGMFVLFYGSEIVHKVQPVTVDRVRVSIPMVFPVHDKPRTPELDQYLFGGD